MKLALAVQILEPLQQFPDDNSDILLLEHPWLEKISAAASREVLHHDPELGATKP